jgi:hypothetical protein
MGITKEPTIRTAKIEVYFPVMHHSEWKIGHKSMSNLGDKNFFFEEVFLMMYLELKIKMRTFITFSFLSSFVGRASIVVLLNQIYLIILI